MATPHRVVDEVVKGIVGGVENIGKSAVTGIKSAGASLTGALDKPIQAVVKKEGPHHIVDRVLTGAVDAAQNLVESGVIGTAKKLGEGIMKGLDHSPEQVGFPPSDVKAPEILKKK